MRTGLRDSAPVLNGPALSCVGRAHVRAADPALGAFALGAPRANVGAGAALARHTALMFNSPAPRGQ